MCPSPQSQLIEPVVVCPQCRHAFPLTKALTGPIEAQVVRRLEAEYARRDHERAEGFGRQLAEATSKAVRRAAREQAAEVKVLQDQITEQSEVISSLQREELAMRKRSRELEAREQALALEVERRVDERSKSIQEEAAKRLLEQHRLKDLEKDKVITDLRQQVAELNRKAHQGSQQVQGDVAEIDLEAQLRQAFPSDLVEPVAKGQRGADILHRVVDPRGQACGTIMYEVKNTKAYSEAWLPKVRDDQRGHGAEIAVLVTTTLPSDIATFAQRGGVWVSGIPTWLPLAHVVRAGLLELARTRVIAEGQAGKQVALLDYVGGTEFRQRVEAILEPLVALMEDSEKERRALEAVWARRQKRLEQVARSVAGLYGDVSGIIGTLPKLQRLELPQGGGEQAA